MSGLCLKWNNHASAFNKLLEKIFCEETYSDAALLCEGKCYPVHRFVLSTCSEYFEQVFDQCSGVSSKHPFIIIKDIESQHLEALLNYMYKGVVNVPQNVLPELIKAAEIFKIRGLAVSDEQFSPFPSKKRHNSESSICSIPSPKRSCQLNESQENDIDIKNISSLTENSDIKSESEFDIKPEPIEVPVDVVEDIPPTSSMFDSKQENYYFENDIPDERESWEKASQNLDECLNVNIGEVFQKRINKIVSLRDAQTQDDPPKIYHPCRFCDYKANLKSSLISHERKHLGLKPFACQFCDYRGTQKIHLQNHLMTHTGEKPYECPQCDFKSAVKFNLDQHMRVHTGERPFACDLCGYRAAQKIALENHVKTHTGEKPYACTMCDYRAVKKNNLSQHISSKHRHILDFQ